MHLVGVLFEFLVKFALEPTKRDTDSSQMSRILYSEETVKLLHLVGVLFEFLVKFALEPTKRDTDSSQMSSILYSEETVKLLKCVLTFAFSAERSILSHSVGVSKFE